MLVFKKAKNMRIQVSGRTKEVICKTLNIKNLKDVIDRSYGGFSIKNDVDREKTVLYSDSNRGSIRLNTGRFYTASEHEERINRAKKLKLP